MTRIIRVELCDECPHAAGSRSCRASQWCDEGGIGEEGAVMTPPPGNVRPDGHDACLGEIPGAAAACCGHGVTEDYILYLPPEV